MDLEGSKSPKYEVFRAVKKSYPLGCRKVFENVFLLQYESANGILTSSKNKMFGKNLVLQLWSKNIWTNQNAGFFKLEYLSNKLRYEAEFLDLTRSP